MPTTTLYFDQNIQFLRRRNGLSQEEVAGKLGVTRSTVNNYENAYAEPGLKLLSMFARFYKLSVDTLLHVDLKKLSESQMREIEEGRDSFIRGTHLRVLATTVDRNNRENIELVPQRAKAGYTAGYNDPEFIRNLPVFQLPFLHSERKYRSFQISGDSMLPIPDKSFVIAEYIEDFGHIRDGEACVLLTRDEGIVFKVVYKQQGKKKRMLLRSLNPAYDPYEISSADLVEAWRFVNYISSELPDPSNTNEDLRDSVAKLSSEAERLMKMLAEKKK